VAKQKIDPRFSVSAKAYLRKIGKAASHDLKLTPEQQASRDLTRMLIATSFLYVAGNLPFTLGFLMMFFSSSFNSLIGFISSYVMFILPGLKLIVYFAFNKAFRTQCFEYLRLTKLASNLEGNAFSIKEWT
jgi:hypothetical protein